MGLTDWIILAGICLVTAGLGTAFLARTGRAAPRGPVDDGQSALLSVTLNNAPIAIWTLDADGHQTWANPAYRAMQEAHKAERTVEDGPVFSIPDITTETFRSLRAALYSQDSGRPEWYDVMWKHQGGTTYCYAQNVSALVNMEDSKRDFFQTMAGTFAQLSTGLAIFDENLRLHLFNPALVELCGLPFSFLSSQPTLAAFFDRLRDSQSMPEPPDYSSWRHEMEDLARAAAEGRYQETWSLPSGSVYQVTGRPHPGGAVAFLFEDISAEVGLARQFRSELDLFQSVVDTIPDPVCVFSGLGKVMLVNTAYRRFWNVPEDQVLRGLSLEELWAKWSDTGRPAPVLGSLGDGEKLPVTASGTYCRTTPLPGDNRMMAFHPAPASARRKVAQPV